MSATISHAVLGAVPHVSDSIAQLFQARIFATAQLWAPAPSLPEFFEAWHMILQDGRWYSQYPPGHALSLLVGVAAGAPWLVNPVLLGVAVLAVHGIAREVFDRATANVAVILAVVSPFLLLMSAGFMSHPSGLAAVGGATWMTLVALRTQQWRWAGVAAALMTWAVLVRPYSALVIAVPLLGIALVGWRRGQGPRCLVGVGVGLVVGCLLLAAYNAGTSGHPLRMGYIQLYGESHGLGFGKGAWGPQHTLARGIDGALDKLRSLNDHLLGWPLTSLWPAALALIVGLQRGDRARSWWLASFPVALLVAHVFYWYHDLCFGPRFLYEGMAALLVVSARGLVVLAHLLARRFRQSGPAIWFPVAAVGGGLTAAALLFYWPVLLSPPASPLKPADDRQVRFESFFRSYGRSYWGADPHLSRLVERRGLTEALVFCRFDELDRLGERDISVHWFGSAMLAQQPDLDGANVVFAHDLGPRNAELMALMPEREVWIYEGTIAAGVLRRFATDTPR